MCFVDFLLNKTSFTDFTILFSSNEYKKNDKLIRNIKNELIL